MTQGVKPFPCNLLGFNTKSMARKRRITRNIKRFVSQYSMLWADHSNWYVGITNEVPRRKATHQRRLGKELEVFHAWQARSAREAADIEKRFLDRGMQGSGGGWRKDSVYVYVYKWRGPYA